VLSSSVVGMVETGGQGFEIGVAGNVDTENFAPDATAKAFDYVIRLRCIGLVVPHSFGLMEMSAYPSIQHNPI
jgi:hypothetical protein